MLVIDYFPCVINFLISEIEYKEYLERGGDFNIKKSFSSDKFHYNHSNS